jgi:hypothetical protein
MIGRSIRQASLKARLVIAAAVLGGGGAIGAVAVATGSHSAPPPTQSGKAQSGNGYTMNFQPPISQQQALSSALSTWATSQQASLATLAGMAPVRTSATVRMGHTTFAAQRGVVALATKHWLLVKSANGSLHLWLLNARTQVKDVAGSAMGLAALTGNTAAARAAMNHNMAPAAAVMAGTANVAAMNATPRPVTFTVSVAGTNVTLTITVTPTTATVKPATMAAARTMAAQTGTAMTMAPARQPVFAAAKHIARGDLVFVTGVVRNHFLWAQLVLFAAPKAVTPAPTPTVTATATPSMMPTGTPTGMPTATKTPTAPATSASAPPTFSGPHS